MKINDYKVGTEFEITCTKEFHPKLKQYVYHHFQISKKHASVWGEKLENVITVKATIIDEDVIIENLMKDISYDNNCIDYFGLVDFNDDGTYDIGLIYPNIKQYFICFAYGPNAVRFWNFDSKDIDTRKYYHKKGNRRSMSVRLKVEEI